MTAAVRAQDLSKTYKNSAGIAVKAVDAVTIDVRQGEILLICGPNGSGKTTLLSLIGCLLKPTSGFLAIDGADVTAYDQNRLTDFRLHRIGFIFQAFRLLDALTVLENVELVLNLAGKGGMPAREKAMGLLEELEIAHRANFFSGVLSGGEKQRVAIARALANDPRLLLADEPTGSLDSHAGRRAVQLLCKAAQDRGKTVIIVSHDERIRDYAQRIVRMEDGHVTEVAEI